MDFFNRTYGVELECIGPSGYSHDQCARELTAAGIEAQHVQYSQHHNRVSSKWKVTTDGSLCGQIGIDYSRSFELVSPPLSSEAGFQQIAKVCEILQRRGFAVNKDCGLHVHVGIRTPEFPFPAMRRLAMLYTENEAILDTIMPPSRKNNTFCRAMTSSSVETLRQCADIDDIADVLYGNRRGTTARNRRTRAVYNLGRERRFVKLNFTAYSTFHTVEFRHHAGTVLAGKISKWIMACLRMVAYAQQTPTATVAADATRTIRMARQGSKRAIVYQHLTRPEGCTQAEVLAATGWPSITLAGHARALGLTLRTVRERGTNGRSVTRYYGVVADPNAASTEAPVSTAAAVATQAEIFKARSIEEFFTKLEATPEELQYWKDRASMFANATAAVARP